MLGRVDHRCVGGILVLMQQASGRSTWLLFSFIVTSHLYPQDIWKCVKRGRHFGNLLLETCQRETCAFCEKCGESDRLKMCQESSAQPGSHQENYHLSHAQPAIKTWKTNSLKMCQESFAQWGSHQENYHLRLAQPAIKLERQTLLCMLFLEWLGHLCIFDVCSISNLLDRHAAPDSVNVQKPTSGEKNINSYWPKTVSKPVFCAYLDPGSKYKNWQFWIWVSRTWPNWIQK